MNRNVAAMIPGRTWSGRWTLKRAASSSAGSSPICRPSGLLKKQLSKVFQPSRRGEFNLNSVPFTSSSSHLQADAHSLDEELSKGMPTRWHLNRDVLDMQKETTLAQPASGHCSNTRLSQEEKASLLDSKVLPGPRLGAGRKSLEFWDWVYSNQSKRSASVNSGSTHLHTATIGIEHWTT